MAWTRRRIAIELLLAVPVLLAGSALAQNPADPTTRSTPAKAASVKTTHHKTVHHPKPLVLPPLAGGPLRQLPMDQIPSNPAKVSFQDGLLSISADNATLGEILGDVRRLTGASIDIPQGSGANERVVTQLGPGAPNQVLARLLNGTSFNYVMVGSDKDPSAVTSVVLTPKTPGGGETQTAVAAPYQAEDPNAAPNRFPHPMPFNQGPPNMQPGAMQAPMPGAQAQPAPAEDDAKDEEDTTDDNANADDPNQQGPQPPDVNIQQQDPNQPNAGPKTPEQILEMLRRQQQQQPGSNPPETPPQQQ